MQIKVTRGDKWRRYVDVEMSVDELAPHFEKALRSYQKRVSLQGFRKGKVPMSMIRKLFGDTIKAETVEEMLPDIFQEVREKESLKVAAPAKIDDYHFEPAQGLRFRAAVDVEPEVDIRNYRGLQLEKTIYIVGDGDVAEAMGGLRERFARFDDSAAGARLNDFVLADIQEVDASGLPLLGKKFEDRYFQLLKEGENDDGFADQLIGAKKGEQRTVRVMRQQNEGKAAEQPVYYQVRVKNVQEKNLPALDDTLAKMVGNYETLEQLRDVLRRQLEADAAARDERNLKNQLIDAILKSNPIELPESMIEFYLDQLVEQTKNEKPGAADEREIRESFRAHTIWNIKWRMLKERLLELEKITLEPDAIEKFVVASATARKKDPRREWNSVKNKGDEVKRLQGDLLEDKLLDHLLGSQKISEKRTTRDEAQKRRLTV